jgi:hypothetical protein
MTPILNYNPSIELALANTKSDFKAISNINRRYCCNIGKKVLDRCLFRLFGVEVIASFSA